MPPLPSPPHQKVLKSRPPKTTILSIIKPSSKCNKQIELSLTGSNLKLSLQAQNRDYLSHFGGVFIFILHFITYDVQLTFIVAYYLYVSEMVSRSRGHLAPESQCCSRRHIQLHMKIRLDDTGRSL